MAAGMGRGHPLMRAKRQAKMSVTGSRTDPEEPERELTTPEGKENAKVLANLNQFGRIGELEVKVEQMEILLAEKERAILAANLEARECRSRMEKAEEDLVQLRGSIQRRTQENSFNRFQEAFKGATPDGYSRLKVGFKEQDEEFESFRTRTTEKEKIYQAQIADLQEMVKKEQGKNKELASIKERLHKDLILERNANQTYADIITGISAATEEFKLIDESKKLIDQRKAGSLICYSGPPGCRDRDSSSRAVEASSTGTSGPLSVVDEEEVEEVDGLSL